MSSFIIKILNKTMRKKNYKVNLLNVRKSLLK